MSKLLEHDSSLTILRVWLGVDRALQGASRSRADAHQVCWQLRVPGSEQPSTGFVRPEELGLPRSFAEASRYRYEEPAFSLPPAFAADVRAGLDRRHDRNAPVWLELAPPCGTLSLVPWERLLQPVLRVSILRLPFFGIPVAENPGSLDVVLCASSPVAKNFIDVQELLGRIIEESIRSLPDGTNLHVFTDAVAFPEMKERLRGRAARHSSHRVYLYDPRQSAASLFKKHRGVNEEPEVESGDSRVDRAITSPWLLWIMSALGSRGVDSVHFLAHGYLRADQGMLVMSESPMENRDEQWGRFIGARELSAFLTRVGAWSVGISIAPSNFSVLGMRLLVDQLARQRVGPVLLHDMSRGDASALGRALRFIFSSATPDSLRSGSGDELPVTLYCHPSRTGDVASMEQANWHLLRHTLAGLQTGERLRSGAALPSWLLAAQRTLERTSAELLEARRSTVEDAERVGVERALSFLSNVVDIDPATQALDSEDAGINPTAEREAL